jgi:hypothetical protein
VQACRVEEKRGAACTVPRKKRNGAAQKKGRECWAVDQKLRERERERDRDREGERERESHEQLKKREVRACTVKEKEMQAFRIEEKRGANL